MTPFSAQGRRILITGAGSESGIGFAAARMFAASGASLFLTGASDRVHDRAAQLRALGSTAESAVFDLTDPTAADELVAKCTSALGGLDVVVNNAGMTSVAAPMHDVGEAGDLTQMQLANWEASLRRNITSAFAVSKAAISHLRQGGAGRIVMVSSVTGPVMAMAHDLAYATSKAAMTGLMRGIAVDEGKYGVTCNAVAPGWIETGSQTPHEARQGQLTPIGRSATPDEVAACIVFLASREAAYVTGQVLVVDGGNSVAEERA